MEIHPATLSTVEVQAFLDRFEELLDDMRSSLRPRGIQGGGAFVLDDATSMRAKVESKVKTAHSAIEQVRQRLREAEAGSPSPLPQQQGADTPPSDLDHL